MSQNLKEKKNITDTYMCSHNLNILFLAETEQSDCVEVAYTKKIISLVRRRGCGFSKLLLHLHFVDSLLVSVYYGLWHLGGNRLSTALHATPPYLS